MYEQIYIKMAGSRKGQQKIQSKINCVMKQRTQCPKYDDNSKKEEENNLHVNNDNSLSLKKFRQKLLAVRLPMIGKQHKISLFAIRNSLTNFIKHVQMKENYL